jgi:hypothetical protein
MLRIAAVLAFLAACGGGRDRLSDADCQRWADRFLQGMGEGVDADLQRDLTADLLKRCQAGDVDREELDCLLASTDLVGDAKCEVGAAKRHPQRKPFDAIIGR